MATRSIPGVEVRAGLRDALSAKYGRAPTDQEVEDAFSIVFAKNRKAIMDGKPVDRIDEGPVGPVSGGTQGDYSRPSDASGGDEFNIDPTAPYALGPKMVSSYLGGLTSGNVQMGGEDAAPNNNLERFMTGASGAVGIGTQMAITAPATGALGLAGRAGRLLNPAIRGGAAFGLYEGLAPAEGIGERAGNIGHGVAMGAALGGAGQIPLVGKLTSNALGRYLYDTALMTGMGVREGAPFGEALASGAGAAAGFGATGAMGHADPRRSRAYQAEELRRVIERASERAKSAEAASAEAQMRAEAEEASRAQLYPPRQTARDAEIIDIMNLPGGGSRPMPERGGQVAPSRFPYSNRPFVRPAQAQAPRDAAVSGSARDYYDVLSPNGNMISGANPAEGTQAVRNLGRGYGYGDVTVGSGLGGAQPAYESAVKAVKDTGAMLRRMSRAARSPLGRNMDKDIAAGLNEVLPIDGVPISEVIARHSRGDLTTDEVVDWIGKNPDKIHGAVSERLLERARAELEAENAALPPGRKIKITDKKVYARAHKMSADAEMMNYAMSGEVPGIKANNWVDPRRQNQAIDRGEISGTVNNRNKRLAEMMERFEVDVANEIAARAGDIFGRGGIERGSAESEAIWWMLEGVNRSGGSKSIDQVAASDKNVADLLSKSDNPDAVISAAKEVADLFEWSWKSRDTVRRAMFGKGLGRQEGYVPHEERDWHILSREGTLANSIKRAPYRAYRKLEKATRPTKEKSAGDNIRYSADEALSSRNRRRTGKLTTDMLEKDIVKLMENYASDTATTLSNSVLVASSKGTTASMEFAAKDFEGQAKQLRKDAETAPDPDALIARAEQLTESAKNLRMTAKGLDEINQFLYNNIGFGLTGKLRSTMSESRFGVAAYKAAAANKRVFNLARYTINVPFMVLRQWTSIGLLGQFPHVTAKDMALAILEGLSPQAGELYGSTYTGWAKGLDMGRVHSEGNSNALSRSVKISKSNPEIVFDRTMSALGRPTNAVEALTGRISVSLGVRIADKLGLTGKVRQDFLSDIVAKTQSEYHKSSRAPGLSDPLVNFLVPAQSYSLESLNGIRENLSDKVGTNFAKTPAEKAAAIGRMVAFTAIANMAYQIVNRKDDLDTPEFWISKIGSDAGAMLPFAAPFTGTGPGEGNLYPASMAKAFGKVNEYVGKGDYERAGLEFVKLFAPGGGQISRYAAAQLMFERGIISEDELGMAQTFGWWTVPSGRAYLENVTGNGESATPVGPRQNTGRGSGPRGTYGRGGGGRGGGGR